MEIADAIRNMLAIVASLRESHPHKRFTLDGRLVGDLGEILAEERYALDLYPKVVPQYDAETKDGRKIQIKCTMKDSIDFPTDYIPQWLLGLKINPDGTIEEIYNGPGAIVWEKIRHRKTPRNRYHCIGLKTLREANKLVEDQDRIQRRPGRTIR